MRATVMMMLKDIAQNSALRDNHDYDDYDNIWSY